ncbi:MAG: DUF1080 domain-containing protein [Phycisphaeraceae bacterium]|nr:DUF1080 domain-containing protein [Phycisphaeraceae bacterium]
MRTLQLRRLVVGIVSGLLFSSVSLAQPQAGTQTLEASIAALPHYEFGDSRAPLALIEAHVAGATSDTAAAQHLADALAPVLTAEASLDAKDFVLRQLALISAPSQIDAIASCLVDERLCPLALRALHRIGSDESAAAIRASIDAARGNALIAIINDVGEHRDAMAAASLQAAGERGDTAIRRAALIALARIADHATADRLVEGISLLDAAHPDFPDVCQAVLEAAHALAEREDADRARSLCVALLNAAEQPAIRSRALLELVRLGDASVIGRLVDDFCGLDASRAATAGRVIATAPGIAFTREVASRLASTPLPLQPALIGRLVERGDPEAAPAVLEYLTSARDDGRTAAIGALATLGDASAVAALLPIASDESDPDHGAARDTLQRLRDAEVDAVLAESLSADRPILSLECLGLLAARRASSQFSAVRALAASGDDPLRSRAFQALGAIAASRDIPSIIQFIDSERVTDVGSAVMAVREACERVADRNARAGFLIQALDQVQMRPRSQALSMMLYRDLRNAGGPVASQRLISELDTGGPSVLASLASWPDDSPAATLLEIARDPADAQQREVAFRGYLSQSAMYQGRSAAETAAMFESALQICASAADRRQVLEAIAHVPMRECLSLAMTLVQDDDVAPDAARAVIAISGDMPTEDRLFAVDALQRVLATFQSPSEIRTAACAAWDRAERNQDFLMSWQCAGPFSRDGVNGSGIFDLAFPPEQRPDDPALIWRAVSVTHANAAHAFNLNAALGTTTDACVYVRTRLHVPEDTTVRLEVGTDDGVKVWLNGAIVHANNAMRGLRVGEDRFNVSLRAGWNTLLLKVTQGGGDWSFACRARLPDGRPVQSLRVDADPAASEPPPGAMLIFDGQDASGFMHRDGGDVTWNVADGAMTVRPGSGAIGTRDAFQDCTVFVEFACSSHPPEITGQQRGNSGVYIQARYEAQILDSFGDAPGLDRCAAIYGVKPPDAAVSRRPGEWQTYLIEFTAPRWDESGGKLSSARMSVTHNGVLVQDDVEVNRATGSGEPEGPSPGPIVLQDHGNPIRFRRVWVVPRSAWEGPDAPGFEPLFDGASLHGWTRRGGEAEYIVQDGAIVGRTRPNQPNTFLCTNRTYRDFVLELEFMIDPELNSGVQIRSESRSEYQDGRVHGYQIEIDPSTRAYTAGIYDEARRGWLVPLDHNERAQDAFRQGQWNRLRIEARGPEIRTWLNGVAAASLRDSLTPEGFIALQVHGVGDRQEPLEVRWKDIRIREIR